MRNQTAIITGGASGIGRALGEELGRRGATVVLADRQIGLATEVAEGIESAGGKAYAVELDVRDADAFSEVAIDARRRTGTVDYLFNNAGIGVGGEVKDYDRASWDDVLDVNIRGVAYGIQAVYPIMRAQRSGHIVNTASMAGLIPMPGGAAYCASKHAVVGMSKSLRIEAEPLGVRVSALCPGVIRTPILTGGAYGRTVGRRLPDSVMRGFWERLRPMDPAQFAVEVLRDVDDNEPFIIVPRWWKAIWLLQRVAPRLALRLSARNFAQMREVMEEHGEEITPPLTTDVPAQAE